MKRFLSLSLALLTLHLPALADDGAASYAMCSACHGPDGKGLKLGPEMLMAPSISGSKFVTGDPEILARIILKGIKKEDAQYQGVMTPLEMVYDDAKLASVINYVRSSFDNTASTDVTADQAKAWREKYKEQKEPSTRAELEAMIKE